MSFMLSLQVARGAGEKRQIGAPTLEVAMESYLSRPKLRSEAHKHTLRLQFEKHLKDWLKLPLAHQGRKPSSRWT